MTDAFHILNPNRNHRRAVRKYIDKNPQLSSMWVERTSHPTHLETLVEWAINEGKSHIIVWGGDGTFSRVINALWQMNALEKMTLSLIPVGTCNDLARKLQFPSWNKIVENGFEGGNIWNLDVGLLSTKAGKKTFINNAGFGRNQAGLRRRSNPIKDILSFEPKRLDIEWETNGATHFETRSALLGVVCNAPFFNGAMHFDNDVDPSDGFLNGFFEGSQSRMSLFLKFVKSKLGGSLHGSKTLRVDAQKIAVESDLDLFPQVDGEPAVNTPVWQVEFSLLPQKLKMTGGN